MLIDENTAAASLEDAAPAADHTTSIIKHRRLGAKLLQSLAHDLKEGRTFGPDELQRRFTVLHMIADDQYAMLDEIASLKSELTAVQHAIEHHFAPAVAQTEELVNDLRDENHQLKSQVKGLLHLIGEHFDDEDVIELHAGNGECSDIGDLELADELAAEAFHDIDPFEGIEIVIDVNHGMTPEAASDLALDTAIDRSVQ